ncbi:MAG: hypothetical protein Q4P07_13585 [Ornithinimicrobium sp.]|uniref:hypothetical protein n=1 Tax=Ornithinimicrobium sp. TaxID=1977084 RepID=UPI0026E0FF5C|nr:hypothetical protein [Ornithinimicrobium sp.]MDO5741169.1 hypothetical protein [Ornithinimicrobium sp.]
MTTQLDDFETRLLQSLRAEVAQRHQPRPRRGFLIAAGVAAAATAFVVAPALMPTPAFSVGEGNAGEIRVTITRPEDASGLERALVEHGINADVTYLPGLQTCSPGRFQKSERATPGLMTSISDRSIAVTIPPGAVRDDETFVLTWSVLPMTDDEIAEQNSDRAEGTNVVNGFGSNVDFAVASGPVHACEPVPASGSPSS